MPDVRLERANEAEEPLSSLVGLLADRVVMDPPLLVHPTRVDLTNIVPMPGRARVEPRT
jgi:hypothetical protein